MNDYAAFTHDAIYSMVKAGLPDQAASWAAGVAQYQQSLSLSISTLRGVLAELADSWSDGAGSARFTADLTAVTDYLELLGDGLSGQPASIADLVAQSAADLAAAQTPAALPPPPPPGMDTASLQSDHALTSSLVADPLSKAQQDAFFMAEVEKAEDARLRAGTTATNPDNNYRNVIARLTAPPAPPPVVLETAGSGAAHTEFTVRPDHGELSAPVGAGPSKAADHAGNMLGRPGAVLVFGPGPMGSPVPVHWTGAVDESVVIGSDGLLPDAAGGLALAGGVLTAGPLRSVPRAPAAAATAGYASGIRQLAATAGLIGSRGIGPGRPGPLSGSPAAERVNGWSAPAGARVLGPAFLGAAVVSGPGGGDARSPGETSGVGGFSALGVGAAFVAGGTTGAASSVNAGGLAVNRLSASGGSTSGSPLAGASAGGSANAGAGIREPGGVGGLAGVRGPAGLGGSAGIGGPGGVGGQASSPHSGNSMIHGGQIGLSGQPLPGSAGYLPGGPAAAGSAIGGARAYRVTWLVEDRDLYGVGPTVVPVIESAPAVALAAVESSGGVAAVERNRPPASGSAGGSELRLIRPP